jgi:hypothetical protein
MKRWKWMVSVTRRMTSREWCEKLICIMSGVFWFGLVKRYRISILKFFVTLPKLAVVIHLLYTSTHDHGIGDGEEGS